MEGSLGRRKPDHTERNYILSLALIAFIGTTGLALDDLSNPKNFPDLADRFRIDRSLDDDGTYHLSVYRSDGGQLNWWDNDLVALEKSVTAECGQLSKFSGTSGTTIPAPVNFRIHQSAPPKPGCDYLK